MPRSTIAGILTAKFRRQAGDRFLRMVAAPEPFGKQQANLAAAPSAQPQDRGSGDDAGEGDEKAIGRECNPEARKLRFRALQGVTSQRPRR